MYVRVHVCARMSARPFKRTTGSSGFHFSSTVEILTTTTTRTTSSRVDDKQRGGEIDKLCELKCTRVCAVERRLVFLWLLLRSFAHSILCAFLRAHAFSPETSTHVALNAAKAVSAWKKPAQCSSLICFALERAQRFCASNKRVSERASARRVRAALLLEFALLAVVVVVALVRVYVFLLHL